MYLLEKFHTFVFILKKYTTVTTDKHFNSQYMVTRALSLCAVLTSLSNMIMKADWHNYLSIIVTFDYSLLQLWLLH
jgi:hypothetical protein